MVKCLSSEVLKGFDTYKYNSLDTSPFSNYVMHPFWNLFVKVLPMWLPANAMTFFGFLLLIVNFFVLSYYDYDFTASMNKLHIPSWVWLMCAFNNFMSHTLDGADGKQARRTNTSSVLGELFDHGLDAWATTFFAIAIYDVYGRGEWGTTPFRMLLIVIGVQMTFVFSHWEKYNTGVLYLPWGYDPAIMGMTLVYVITYIFGVEVWQHRIQLAGNHYSIATYLEVLLYIANFACSVPICILNVLLSYRNKTGKMRPFMEAMRPLVPVSILFPLCITWSYFSPTNILENYPRCYYLLSGVLFANITSQLIVNQMSNTQASAFNFMLLPLMFIVPTCTCFNLGIWEVYILHAYTMMTTLAHIYYGVSVVKEMTDYLNIYAFSTKKPPPKIKKSY